VLTVEISHQCDRGHCLEFCASVSANAGVLVARSPEVNDHVQDRPDRPAGTNSPSSLSASGVGWGKGIRVGFPGFERVTVGFKSVINCFSASRFG